MNNIEYSLMAILLNYPEKIKDVRYNIFLQDKTKKLYNVLILQKSYNKAIILDVIQTENNYEVDDFEEIYSYYFEIDEYKNYYDYVLANYLRYFFFENSKRMLTMKELSSFEIKQKIQNLINESSIDEEGEIVTSQEVLKEMLEAEKAGSICKLVTSDMEYFDTWGGFEADDFVIIAARANLGKSTTAINMASRNLISGKKVGFFSLETNRKKLMSIMSCALAGVEELKYRTGMLTDQEKTKLYYAFEKLYDKKLFIDDTSGLDIEQFKRKARIMKSKYDVEIIYLDY
ncbi:MAG TPA: DnaB-like helicase C-terminal domain-containing protein, partial [Candidatus Lokiarchaeia archaeon]